MEKITKIFGIGLLSMILLGTIGIGNVMATTYTQDCPTSLVGAHWYGPVGLGDKYCDALYYTYSMCWYKDDWGYDYASWYDEGPSSGNWYQYAYIPSTDYYETNGVFYLLWDASEQEELANQEISQYGTSGWGYLWYHSFTQDYRVVLTDMADCQGSYYCYMEDECSHIHCCTTGDWECDWGYCCEGKAYADAVKWQN